MTFVTICSALLLSAAAEAAAPARPPPPEPRPVAAPAPPPGPPPAASPAAPGQAPAAAPPAPAAPAPAAPPPLPAAAPAAAPEKDPRALALIKKMSDRLASARDYTVQCRITLELPGPGGLLATHFNKGSLAVQRPDKVAASRTGDLPELRFAYDGKVMNLLLPATRQWATVAAPPTIDEMLGEAFAQGGLSLPFDELLVANPYAALTGEATQASLLDPKVVDGRKADHVLLASPGLELQYWLDQASGLPVRTVAVYADHPLRPHFSVEYSDWRVDKKVKGSTFALPMPAGATRIEFRAAAAAFR